MVGLNNCFVHHLAICCHLILNCHFCSDNMHTRNIPLALSQGFTKFYLNFLLWLDEEMVVAVPKRDYIPPVSKKVRVLYIGGLLQSVLRQIKDDSQSSRWGYREWPVLYSGLLQSISRLSLLPIAHFSIINPFNINTSLISTFIARQTYILILTLINPRIY